MSAWGEQKELTHHKGGGFHTLGNITQLVCGFSISNSLLPFVVLTFFLVGSASSFSSERFSAYVSISKALMSPAATKMCGMLFCVCVECFHWGEGLLFLEPYYVPCIPGSPRRWMVFVLPILQMKELRLKEAKSLIQRFLGSYRAGVGIPSLIAMIRLLWEPQNSGENLVAENRDSGVKSLLLASCIIWNKLLICTIGLWWESVPRQTLLTAVADTRPGSNGERLSHLAKATEEVSGSGFEPRPGRPWSGS